MSFNDALKSALPAFEHTCASRIRGELTGYHSLMLEEVSFVYPLLLGNFGTAP
jgi:hypothetical protein